MKQLLQEIFDLVCFLTSVVIALAAMLAVVIAPIVLVAVLVVTVKSVLHL